MIKAQRLKTSCGEFNNDLVKYNSSTLLLKAIGIRNERSKKKNRTNNLHKSNQSKSNDNHFSLKYGDLLSFSVTDV